MKCCLMLIYRKTLFILSSQTKIIKNEQYYRFCNYTSWKAGTI